VTRLRKMMLEELQRRNYSAITTRNYLRVVSDFAKHFGKSPDKLGPNELRTYQAYLLTECKLTPGSVVNRVAALRFFFVKTLKRHQFREFLPYGRPASRGASRRVGPVRLRAEAGVRSASQTNDGLADDDRAGGAGWAVRGWHAPEQP
jgi:hypothetical protein